MQCNAMQCNGMPCHAMACHTMQCNAMQCNAMQCIETYVRTYNTYITLHVSPRAHSAGAGYTH
eukprot:219073-Heterocapsa_arctica.AAC.1